jgi:hypothetical protein
MDEYGYPTEETLELIRNWPYTDFNGLMDFVISLWQYPDYVEDIKVINDFDKEVREVNISTGGWSGNEEIIGALMENTMFWIMCWQISKRGGHYRFHI